MGGKVRAAALPVALAGAATWAVLAAAPAASPAAPQWASLFDGRSTAGWRMTGPGGFTVERGALVTRGGMGLLWYERRPFGDFELELDWKVAARCANSGVFVRFPERPGSPLDAVAGGYEVQIDDCDPDGPHQRTGAIYDAAPARRPASRPPGRWNRYRIRVVGQHYTVFLNGARVTDFDGTRGLAGYVGLQNHDPGSRVSFTRIRVREIGEPGSPDRGIEARAPAADERAWRRRSSRWIQSVFTPCRTQTRRVSPRRSRFFAQRSRCRTAGPSS